MSERSYWVLQYADGTQESYDDGPMPGLGSVWDNERDALAQVGRLCLDGRRFRPDDEVPKPARIWVLSDARYAELCEALEGIMRLRREGVVTP